MPRRPVETYNGSPRNPGPLIFAVALLGLCASPAVPQVDGVISDVHSLPMCFEWRQETGRHLRQHLRSWVTAVGVITSGTSAEFNTFVQGRDVQDTASVAGEAIAR
jgi:hypothetical protein